MFDEFFQRWKKGKENILLPCPYLSFVHSLPCPVKATLSLIRDRHCISATNHQLPENFLKPLYFPSWVMSGFLLPHSFILPYMSLTFALRSSTP